MSTTTTVTHSDGTVISVTTTAAATKEGEIQSEAPPLHETLAAHSLAFQELSPLLSVLDALLGHAVPIATPSPPENGEQQAEWDLAMTSNMHLRFLTSALPSIRASLAKIGVEVSRVAAKPALILRHISNAALVSRDEVYNLIKVIEARLADPDVVLALLKPAATEVMKSCTEVIAANCDYLNFDKHTFKVQFAAMFNEEWSIGIETAWEATPSEGILVMPDYPGWSEAHIAHRAKSWRGISDGVSKGRIWRFEYWECLRTPCHEVIHLVQGVANQKMTHQIAEHDGAFSTYLLMLGVRRHRARQASATAPEPEGGSAGDGAECGTLDGLYFPGATEEAMLESQDFGVRTVQGSDEGSPTTLTCEKEQDYTAWRNSFGMCNCPRWGDNKSFKNDKLVTENMCKNMLALEAVCPTGKVLEGDAVDVAVKGMLDTMFKDRTDVDLSAAVPERHAMMPKIDASIVLSGMTVRERLASLAAPVGVEAVDNMFNRARIP